MRMAVDLFGQIARAPTARSRERKTRRSRFCCNETKIITSIAMPAAARYRLPDLAVGMLPSNDLTISHRAVGKQAHMAKSHIGIRGRPPLSE